MAPLVVSLMAPLMVSLSNHPGSVLRQAQDERGGYIPFMTPLMVSLSNHPSPVLRQAQDERRGQGGEFRGNRHWHPKQPPLLTTVVPAKAGIQEIPRERAGRLPRILDSGFRQNDGFMVWLTWGLSGILTVCWYYHPRRGGFVTRPGSNPGVSELGRARFPIFPCR